MRIAIVGAGLAGTLLAWRLRQLRPALTLSVHTLPAPGGDATAASGGLVRGFEPAAEAARVAGASLAELLADPDLRDAAGYREIGSLYVLGPGAEISDPLKVVEEWLPGSATVLDRAALRRLGLCGLPPGAIGVQESRAGFLSPSRLRDAVLARLGPAGVEVHRSPVTEVGAGGHLTLADGRRSRHDAVVVAAGAWTPRLLGGPGAAGLRTRRIQYTICLSALPRIGSFVDETSGLYGRPLSPEIMLLGVPTTGWDVDPGRVGVDPAVLDTLRETVRHRFGQPVTPLRSIAAADCYAEPGGLVLRPAGPGLFTFTGGSGGAAKAALASTRHAAVALTDLLGS